MPPFDVAVWLDAGELSRAQLDGIGVSSVGLWLAEVAVGKPGQTVEGASVCSGWWAVAGRM